jgi:ribosome-binding factor A
VKNVTVLGVDVAGDLRSGKVYVSVMGDERTQNLCLFGLNSARGFLQAKVADRLQTRYTPVLTFVLDQSVKQSFEASRLIREALGDGGVDPAQQNPPPDENEIGDE